MNFELIFNKKVKGHIDKLYILGYVLITCDYLKEYGGKVA